jgi:chitodextrinase
VNWVTNFNIYSPGDYKECVCFYENGACDLNPQTIPGPTADEVTDDNNNDPVPDDNNNDPVPDDNNNDPIPDDNNNDPVPDDNNNDPVPDDNNNDPVPDDNNNDPVPDDNNNDPVPDDNNNDPVPDDNNNDPVPDDNNNDPVPVDPSEAPDMTPQPDTLADQGPWTGYDWIDEVNGFKAVNGQIFGTKDSTIRSLWSAQARFNTPDVDFVNHENNAANVQRVLRVLPEATAWEYLTPFRVAEYTYQNFVTAVSKFPSFCGERGTVGRAAFMTDDEMCMKELATLFAHFSQETGYHGPGAAAPVGTAGEGEIVQEEWRQAFYYLREIACDKDYPAAHCDYYSTSWGNDVNYPRPNADAKYFGRGSFQLSWNYNYGRYSKVQFGDVSTLLNDPDRVAREGWLAVASALWFYQTP